MKGKTFWEKELSKTIPNLKDWSHEELDILIDYVYRNVLANPENNPINELLNNYKCSVVDELRQAISTLITCSKWHSYDEVHHCAVFMATASTPIPEYVGKAISILSKISEAAKRDPGGYGLNAAQELESAISFLRRFEN